MVSYDIEFRSDIILLRARLGGAPLEREEDEKATSPHSHSRSYLARRGRLKLEKTK